MGDGSLPPFGFSEQVQVCTDSTCATSIGDAVVKVNGTTLDFNSNHSDYEGSVLIAKGASVTVEVIKGGKTYSATGTQFTSAPTISSPTDSANWSASSSNSVTWSGGAPTSGASYVVGLLNSNGFIYPAGDHGPQEVSLSTLTQTIPGGTLPTGTAGVFVGIGNTGIVGETSGGHSFSGASSDSGLWLGLVAPLVGIKCELKRTVPRIRPRPSSPQGPRPCHVPQRSAPPREKEKKRTPRHPKIASPQRPPGPNLLEAETRPRLRAVAQKPRSRKKRRDPFFYSRDQRFSRVSTFSGWRRAPWRGKSRPGSRPSCR